MVTIGAKFPDWIKISAADPEPLLRMKRLSDGLGLHTVCVSAHCPNQGDCFSRGMVTFMILGDICTRRCSFCAVNSSRPAEPDPGEPERVAQASRQLGLKYVVVTSVTRDDLGDGGASHFAATVSALRSYNPGVGIEALIPDFGGSPTALNTVVASSLSVLNHNVETVPRLYPRIRPQADYHRSLELLARAKGFDANLRTKSGMMLGLGEEREEVISVMPDLREAHCDFLTIGQYLPPSANHYPLARFISPEEFGDYRQLGEKLGFTSVASAPLVRSSFRAAEMFRTAEISRTLPTSATILQIRP
jgi:lipoyl synthase